MTDIVQNFDRAAEGYEYHAAPQAALAATLATWVPLEERHGLAIEFGAGTGLFTQRISPWEGPYLATDAAPHMVATGLQRCPQVAWKQHDARDAKILGPADWIFACNLLQWLENPEAVLSDWRNTLKPGGHLVLAVLLPETLCELREVLPEAQTLNWRKAEEWQEILERTGFSIVRAETWKHIQIYPSALDFLRAVHDLGLAPQRLAGPGRLRAALRQYDRDFAITGGVRSTWQAWLAGAVAI